MKKKYNYQHQADAYYEEERLAMKTQVESDISRLLESLVNNFRDDIYMKLNKNTNDIGILKNNNHCHYKTEIEQIKKHMEDSHFFRDRQTENKMKIEYLDEKCKNIDIMLKNFIVDMQKQISKFNWWLITAMSTMIVSFLGNFVNNYFNHISK